MADLFSAQPFPSFGPHGLEGAGDVQPVHTISAARNAGLRACLRVECPRRPGVYGMLDQHGELIYVGKAKCLRHRLLSYFRPRSRGPKAGRILRFTRTIVWEPALCEFGALLRELELIRRWRPRFNVFGQPRRPHRLFVCLGRAPAPYAFLARRPARNTRAAFGPVPGGPKATTAVRHLNDWFRLIDCPQAQTMYFAEEELFPVLRTPGCLRFDIGTCLAPCAAACTRSAYMERVRAARAFLTGTDDTPFTALAEEMAKAAQAQLYERAAALRDRLDSLRWLRDHIERLRHSCERQSFIYPVRAADGGGQLWYLVQGGRAVAVTRRPTDGDSRAATASILGTIYEKRRAELALPRPEEMDSVFLVASWFRKQPKERLRAMSPDDALRLCKHAS